MKVRKLALQTFSDAFLRTFDFFFLVDFNSILLIKQLFWEEMHKTTRYNHP